MDWEQANFMLYNAHSGRRMASKNVAHRTVLRRSAGDAISLDVFEKSGVIIWFKNGELCLHNHGYWSYVTKDRLKAFLPKGFALVQDRPFWFLRTPTGARPWRNGMIVAKDGVGIAGAGFVPPLDRCDAIQLRDAVREYAKELVAALLRGELDHEPSCVTCTNSSEGKSVEHCFGHLRRRDMDIGILLASLHKNSRSQGRYSRATGEHIPVRLLERVVFSSLRQAYFLRHKARTKRDQIRQTELRMTLPEDQLPREELNPRHFAWNLREILTAYLLRNFGFEEMGR